MGIYKVWQGGSGTLVITISKDLADAKGIKEGDYLEIPSIEKITPPPKPIETEEDIELKRKKIHIK